MVEFNVGVVGAGYVGLVTAACLASIGHQAVCVDVDEEKVDSLRRGLPPIYEPGLEDLMDGSGERLRFTTNLAATAQMSDLLFIAVGTPQDEDGSADLSSVAAVARGIGLALADPGAPPRADASPLVVVNKSTVPVGSGDYVSMLIQDGIEEAATERRSGEEPPRFHVVSNPEFLREGSAVYDSLYPDRIVAGSPSREALDILRAVYEPIVEQSFRTELDPRPKQAVPFVTTDLASAEMTKYAANAFLAAKISFANEMASICELVGADVSEVAHGIGLDERIGPRFLSAGLGWDGSGFPKDVAALRAAAREYEYEPPILNAIVAVNSGQRKRVIAKLQGELRTLKGKRIVLLGLSYKPNTDDIREAPALEIARSLDALGARVIGYDPVSGKAAARKLPMLEIAPDPYTALARANAAVVVTEWAEIRELDWNRAASLMERPAVVVDGRNALDPAVVRGAGIRYRGFGRG